MGEVGCRHHFGPVPSRTLARPRFWQFSRSLYGVHPRGLAGKPLAGFRATPDRRIIVLYGIAGYAIRFRNPLLHRQSTLRKRRLGENRSLRPHFQRDAACARGKAWHGVDVQRVGGTPWKAYAGGTAVPPMRNAQMTIPFMIATGTNEMRTTAKARRVDV